MDGALTILGYELTIPVLTLGAILGMTYGILAVGLVLVHRANRIINFAHGEVGAFAAAIFGLLVTRWSVPYWVAFPVGLAAGGAVSALAEVAVIRRLRDAPRLMSIVATLGVGQFLLVFSLVVNAQARAGQLFPQPSFLPSFNIGALRVTPAHFGMLVLTPLLVAGIGIFLRRSKFGLGMRASANNPEAARLTGIFASRMSTLAWVIAGGVSAYTAILFSPTRGFVAAESFGPGLLLRALVAAVVARMTSLPVALAAGVGVGIVEQTLLWNYPRGGLVEAVLFVVILIALLVQRRTGSAREESKGSWAAVQAWSPLPDAFRQVPSIRNLGRVVAAGSLALAVLLPLVISNATAVIFTTIVAFAIVGLSIGIVTGLGGQLTLGQFAIAAVGATVSYRVSFATGNFFLSFAAAALVAAAVAVVIGLPALRLRGLMLAVTTLSFALATQAWIIQQPWMLGEGVNPGRPILGEVVLDTGRTYYWFSLVILLVAIWFARNVRRGAIGRRLVAVRDNEDNARAFTVSATRVKLEGFALAGMVAGLGGAVFGHALSRLGATAFLVTSSIDVVVMSVIGGLGVLFGPLLGALYVIGVPQLPIDSAGLAATSLGGLILILYAPGGLARILSPVRDRIVDRLARRAGLDPVTERAKADNLPQTADGSVDDLRVAGAAVDDARTRDGEVVLAATGLRRHYGGVRAVDGVDVVVRRGEILGLIGPNGAGKTTTFELLGGFNELDAGAVHFDGRDVTDHTPEQRARLGLIRSFQAADLFPTLTVLETVRLARERANPTNLALSLVGRDPDEAERDRVARQVITAMGLDRYRDRQIRELSTGTRRITEIACLVALEPKVLLLDEPSSGIAQKETEALGVLLRRLRDQLGITMVVIEHDIPLIMGLADRIIAMDTGRVIAAGTPHEVRNHPQVVESYLGGNTAAIERSGATATASSDNGHAPRLADLLRGIAGIGPAKQAAMLAAFDDVTAVRDAGVRGLVTVPGIGAATAARILDELDRTTAGVR